MASAGSSYDSDVGDLKYSFPDRSSEELWTPPSDEFLFDPDVLDALNHVAPATVAPTALHRSSPTTMPCTHPLKYETSSSHSIASSSHASPQASCDGTYVPSPSPEYLPMSPMTQTGGYSHRRHSEVYSAYSVGPVSHHTTQQTLSNQIPDSHLLSYLERVTLAPKLRGRGARGGAAGYICRWPGCKWPRISRRDHAKNHIAAHMNLRPHGCTKCPRAFLRAFDLRRHSKSCRRNWVEVREPCGAIELFSESRRFQDGFRSKKGLTPLYYRMDPLTTNEYAYAQAEKFFSGYIVTEDTSAKLCTTAFPLKGILLGLILRVALDLVCFYFGIYTNDSIPSARPPQRLTIPRMCSTFRPTEAVGDLYG